MNIKKIVSVLGIILTLFVNSNLVYADDAFSAPLMDIKFFGNLPYNVNLIEVIQKFDGYSSVKNITLSTDGIDKEELSNWLGINADDCMDGAKMKSYCELRVVAKTMNTIAMAAPLMMLDNPTSLNPFEKIKKHFKTGNIKNQSNPENLKTILSNIYNANKEFMAFNVLKIPNKDNNTSLVYNAEIIVDANDVILNGIPFHAKAVFSISEPYFQYEYKSVIKSANGLYWPHYLKELVLTSNENFVIDENTKNNILSSFELKYTEALCEQSVTTERFDGQNVAIVINSSDRLVITYTNKYDFDNIYQNKLDEYIKNKNLIEQQKLRQQYQNINMDNEI